MSLREEQCKKVCRILDDVLANRPTERDSLIVATRSAFSALSELGTNLAEVGTDAISRQKAIDAIEAEKIKHGDYLTSSYVGYEMAEKVVKQLPPIQPKRGRWIEDKGQQTLMKNFIERGEVWRVCSVCGAGHMIGHKYATDKAYHDMHHNFCPNCGAKMEVTT